MLRLLPIALALLAAPALAQAAEEHFHRAARLFVDGEMEPAEAEATEGLRLDPEHRRLRALLEEIQKKGDGGGRQDEDAEPRPDEPDAEGPEPDEPDAEPRPDEPGPPEPEAPPEDAEPEAERQEQAGTGDEGEATPEDARGGGDTTAPFETGPGEMSREEAERILRALEADELELLRSVQRRSPRVRFIEKDW